MNFLKNKVKRYQEKKLDEANQKLEYYKETRKNLEKQLQNSTDQKYDEIKAQIDKQNEFIEIWTRNIVAIKKEIQKLKS
jgi:chromosome segregation ATPase